MILSTDINTCMVLQKGFTPLHIAAQKGKVECVTYLLQSGANIKALTKVSNIVYYGLWHNVHRGCLYYIQQGW